MKEAKSRSYIVLPFTMGSVGKGNTKFRVLFFFFLFFFEHYFHLIVIIVCI